MKDLPVSPVDDRFIEVSSGAQPLAILQVITNLDERRHYPGVQACQYHERHTSGGQSMRFASVGHAVFAATMIALGILGFVKNQYVAIWQPIPHGVSALVYLCAMVSLLTGIGMLWQRTASVAARVLLAYLLLWLVVVRIPGIFFSPTVDYWWAACKTAVMAAAAWVLCVWLARERQTGPLGFVTGDSGLRLARIVYGAALIPFGIAHFIYLQPTASLVPTWLPARVALASLTGGAFILAGIAVIIGVYARLAAALSALQIGLFTLLVWGPVVVAGPKNAFQWSEAIVSATLTAGAWVVADSYRDVPWLAWVAATRAKDNEGPRHYTSDPTA